MQISSNKGILNREGTVEFISPVVDPASDLVTVKILFKNNDVSVKPGVSGFLLVGE